MKKCNSGSGYPTISRYDPLNKSSKLSISRIYFSRVKGSSSRNDLVRTSSILGGHITLGGLHRCNGHQSGWKLQKVFIVCGQQFWKICEQPVIKKGGTIFIYTNDTKLGRSFRACFSGKQESWGRSLFVGTFKSDKWKQVILSHSDRKALEDTPHSNVVTTSNWE